MNASRTSKRKLTGIEKAAAVLAAVFIIGGAISAFWPVDMTYFPRSNSRVAGVVRRQPVHLSKQDARLFGYLEVGMGLGLGYLALFVGRGR